MRCSNKVVFPTPLAPLIPISLASQLIFSYKYEPLITDAVSKAVKASLNPEEKYCTVQQAMEMLHCSLASVYRYKDQGKFSFQKIGGKTLILREELNAAVQERKEWKLKAR